jgi:hypothetical protein
MARGKIVILERRGQSTRTRILELPEHFKGGYLSPRLLFEKILSYALGLELPQLREMTGSAEQ